MRWKRRGCGTTGRGQRHEKTFQDAYCDDAGLPREESSGFRIENTSLRPDYYHETVGWLEFVIDGKVEIKDIVDYPSAIRKTKDTRYTLVLDSKPSEEFVVAMDKLGVEWKLFIPAKVQPRVAVTRNWNMHITNLCHCGKSKAASFRVCYDCWVQSKTSPRSYEMERVWADKQVVKNSQG
jgi:hypothetical protein